MKTFDPTYRVKRLDGETFRWVDDPCEAAIMRLYAYGKSLAFEGHSDELVGNELIRLAADHYPLLDVTFTVSRGRVVIGWRNAIAANCSDYQ